MIFVVVIDYKNVLLPKFQAFLLFDVPYSYTYYLDFIKKLHAIFNLLSFHYNKQQILLNARNSYNEQ